MNHLGLKRGEILKLRGASGQELRVTHGRVWLTEEASNEDIWLEPGGRARISGDGLALVEAFAASCITID